MSAANEQFTYDELTFLQTVPTRVLAAAARGELDFNELARSELASRGCDESGAWVGFERSREVTLNVQATVAGVRARGA